MYGIYMRVGSVAYLTGIVIYNTKSKKKAKNKKAKRERKKCSQEKKVCHDPESNRDLQSHNLLYWPLYYHSQKFVLQITLKSWSLFTGLTLP